MVHKSCNYSGISLLELQWVTADSGINTIDLIVHVDVIKYILKAKTSAWKET